MRCSVDFMGFIHHIDWDSTKWWFNCQKYACKSIDLQWKCYSQTYFFPTNMSASSNLLYSLNQSIDLLKSLHKLVQ